MADATQDKVEKAKPEVKKPKAEGKSFFSKLLSNFKDKKEKKPVTAPKAVETPAEVAAEAPKVEEAAAPAAEVATAAPVDAV